MSDCKCCKAVPGTGGEKYIPMEERTGEESTVYFTRDLSPEGLQKIFDCIKKFIWEMTDISFLMQTMTTKLSPQKKQ